MKSKDGEQPPHPLALRLGAARLWPAITLECARACVRVCVFVRVGEGEGECDWANRSATGSETAWLLLLQQHIKCMDARGPTGRSSEQRPPAGFTHAGGQKATAHTHKHTH